jgi:hypothetical protein
MSETTEPLTLNDLTAEERAALIVAYQLMIDTLDNDKA